MIQNLKQPPSAALVRAVENIPPGEALDLACGAGRHAIYLAGKGWRVTAVDSSSAALARLSEQASGLNIAVQRLDLEKQEFDIRPGAYDLIVTWLYLQRDLFPHIRSGVRLGGLAAAAALMHGRFAAQPGELVHAFEGWDILHYEENADVSEIVAQKKTASERL